MTGASLSRIEAIAENTFREAIRMRLFLLLVFTGVASLAAGLYFKEFNLGSSELRFISDFGFGAMTFLGSIIAVVVTVQLFYGEIERRSVLPILSKPISRWEYLLGKILGVWGTICSFIAIITLALVLALWIRIGQIGISREELAAMGQGIDFSGIALFAFLQCFRLVVLVAVTAFFCSYATSSMFAVFMGFFAWILTQMRSVIAAHWGQGGGLAEQLAKGVSLLVPDLRLFEVGGLLLGANGLSLVETLQLIAYALLYAFLYGFLATLVFRRREF